MKDAERIRCVTRVGGSTTQAHNRATHAFEPAVNRSIACIMAVGERGTMVALKHVRQRAHAHQNSSCTPARIANEARIEWENRARNGSLERRHRRAHKPHMVVIPRRDAMIDTITLDFEYKELRAGAADGYSRKDSHSAMKTPGAS